jgi:hypothetical protein
MNTNQLSWKDAPKWLKVITVIALINVLSFTVISFYLGGDALFGKEEQGLFYLYSHGHYTEVPEKVFEYSKFHVYSVLATNLLAIILWGIFALRRKIKRAD